MKQKKDYLFGWTFVNRYGILDNTNKVIKAYSKKQAIAYFKLTYAKSFAYCKYLKPEPCASVHKRLYNIVKSIKENVI